MTVILGLGNPGPQYANTRHNVGFWCLDRLQRKHGIRLDQKHRYAEFGEGVIGGRPVVLAKPRTFMNRSGLAARYLLDRYREEPGALLVVYDDMDLPVGRLRVRPEGSAGGHNGMKSIIAELGTQAFPRVRIGVDHPVSRDTVSHVLGGFAGTDAQIMQQVLEWGVEAVERVVEEGAEAAMNRYNHRIARLDDTL